MAGKNSRRPKNNGNGPRDRKPAQKTERPTNSGPPTVRAVWRPALNAWELVHPRCAREREEDLEEVRKMVDAGELDVARDECRWLLEGCHDCLEAHRLVGEIALAEGDLPLARGHFGYAYRLGAMALERAGAKGPLPFRLPANQGFFRAGKALAECLARLDKPQMAAEVVALLAACDPSAASS